MTTSRFVTRWLLGGLAGGALLAGLALAAGSPFSTRAQAQETSVPTQRGITVLGDGIISAQPDTTTVRLGIEVVSQGPAEALNETRQRAERVIARLRELGIPENDIQTSSLNVFPVQGAPRDPNSTPAITGYRGSASVTADVQDVSRVSALLTAGFEAGANSVQGLTFGIRDTAALRRQALQAAIADARPKAEAAAQAAGLRLGAIRSVVELNTGGPVQPLGRGGGGGEGIAPGELDITIRAQVTFEVG